MYEITQTTTKERLFRSPKQIDKVYKFYKYNDALIFALNEQKRYFKHVLNNKVASTRDAYAMHYSCINWIKHAKNNPLHYTGRNSTENINLERLYYYYVNSNNLHRLRKHI